MIDIGNDNLDNELNIAKNKNNWYEFQEFQYDQLFQGKITLADYLKTTQHMDNKHTK